MPADVPGKRRPFLKIYLGAIRRHEGLRHCTEPQLLLWKHSPRKILRSGSFIKLQHRWEKRYKQILSWLFFIQDFIQDENKNEIISILVILDNVFVIYLLLFSFYLKNPFKKPITNRSFLHRLNLILQYLVKNGTLFIQTGIFRVLFHLCKMIFKIYKNLWIYIQV